LFGALLSQKAIYLPRSSRFLCTPELVYLLVADHLVQSVG